MNHYMPYVSSANVITAGYAAGAGVEYGRKNHVESPHGSSSPLEANTELITYIFPDFNAVNYFKRDFIASNEFFSMEETVASGFDIYLVEQWVNERRIGTVVTTYTGNLAAQVKVTKFTILKKQLKLYPAKFQQYLHELMMNHAKIKKMDDKQSTLASRRNSTSNHLVSADEGAIDSISVEGSNNEVSFVTNLSSLPSILNLIPLAKGDWRETLGNFIINSNLKKLQCGGRSLHMTSERVSDANEDKFRHMYKILNPKIPIKFCIRELVNIIQTCLFYFDLLDAKYCDGLLCNKTEEAITNWWNLIGLPHFNMKPNPQHGILSSTTVAAIISLVLSIKLRLQLIGGCDVPKDPFDFENFMISIGHFQKQFKLEKRRKLDLETLNRIFYVTNAKLLPERSLNFSQYPQTATNDNHNIGQTHDLLDYERNLSPVGSMSSVAPYRKNKSYYSKELKKFTNVVKITLQDPMRDSEDVSNQKLSSGRIRNKIAKLADAISPLEVETLDLEFLVRNYLIGKTLIRLFLGATKNPSLVNLLRSSEAIDGSAWENMQTVKKNKGVRGNRRVSDSTPNTYSFMSLKDKIAVHQPYNGYRSPVNVLEPSKYTRGFNRVKFGIQNRKNILSTNKAGPKEQRSQGYLGQNAYEDGARGEDVSTAMDSYLEFQGMGSNAPGAYAENESKSSLICNQSIKSVSHDPVKQFQQRLNRRKSYPCDKGDINLNLLAFTRKDKPMCVASFQDITSKGRRASFSVVEDALTQGKTDNLFTVEKFSKEYMSTVGDLLTYEALRNTYDHPEKDSSLHGEMDAPEGQSMVKRQYKLLNLELVKVKNAMTQMLATKAKVIDEDFIGNLEYNIHDLTTIVDRLVYETRIVAKRINELEENYKMFDMKLNHQCKNNLTSIIHSTVNSSKFTKVFPDISEREDLIKRLEYDKIEIPGTTQEVENAPVGFFQLIVQFIYEMILTISQVFRFNRSNMNLERIRAIWGKLDPDRDIIDKAYTYVGRKPSRMSTSSSLDDLAGN